MCLFRKSLFCIIFFLLLSGCGTVKTSVDTINESYYAISDSYDCYYDKIKDDPARRDLYLNIQSIFEDYRYDRLSYLYDVGFSEKELFLETVRMVVYDHPEYGVYYDGLAWSLTTDNDVLFDPEHGADMFVSDDVYQKLYDSIILDDSLSNREIAYRLFIWFSENIVYDDTYDGLSHTDHNVIYHHKGCCQGVSFAYKRLLDCAGIESFVFTGYNENDEYHMLNAVRINHEFVFIDVTGGMSGRPSRDSYFCMTRSVFDQCMKSFVLTCFS